MARVMVMRLSKPLYARSVLLSSHSWVSYRNMYALQSSNVIHSLAFTRPSLPQSLSLPSQTINSKKSGSIPINSSHFSPRFLAMQCQDIRWISSMKLYRSRPHTHTLAGGGGECTSVISFPRGGLARVRHSARVDVFCFARRVW